MRRQYRKYITHFRPKWNWDANSDGPVEFHQNRGGQEKFSLFKFYFDLECFTDPTLHCLKLRVHLRIFHAIFARLCTFASPVSQATHARKSY